MNLRALPLPVGLPGRLWLHSMPGRLEPWAQFEALAAQAGLSRIVCLTPWDEIDRLAPAYGRAIHAQPPWHWQHLPMQDFGLHSDAQSYADGVGQIVAALRQGESVLLHCAAGIGRTGSTAACVLKSLGLSADAALAQVRAAGSNPQSAAQSGLLDAF
ncbi:atypical dual specificity phosphatase [Inhella inkyongensis]|uniref:Atypical dual specificity phosphatase n=1 Tax=Inhella inkyongensis TaxID=392593 RepID=A0A840SCQ0_9BURK|nr:tyrosine-protein phosphatase [Inhella inkyongensis]MBB5206099.1 atypical dual specificity phosphatase [Inhella inkyongensis]